ncbi:MAG: hypothetical protein M0002_10815, partial [Rhodospirillales bacterium]|nr:hypothetical protein [Rhodospirillales bacterium]
MPPDPQPVTPVSRAPSETRDAAPPVGPAVSTTIVFHPTAPARFARFPGSAWRGAFGHSLKRLVCVMHLRPCEGCALHHTCIFPQVFEPPIPPDAPILANYRVAPTAFVLDPPETPRSGFYSERDPIPVTLRLFGRLTRFAPYVVQALLQAAAHGVGPDRAPLAPHLLAPGLEPDFTAAHPFTPDAASASPSRARSARAAAILVIARSTARGTRAVRRSN